jgi:predicted dehydrogenase
MGSHHARVVAESKVATLATLIDPARENGERVAALHGATWRPELDDSLEVDAVIVAAATEVHYELAREVVGRGIPLLVEKPVTADLAQTRDLVERSIASGVPLMCGLLERYNPAILTAAAMIENPLHIIGTRHSPYAKRIRTGVAWDLLVHDVDLALRLMGDAPSSTFGTVAYVHPDSLAGAEDIAEASLSFSGSRLAHLSASRIGQRKVRHLSVYEPNKLIEIDLLRRDVTVYRNVSETLEEGAIRGYRQQAVIEIPELVTNQEPLVTQFQRFVDLIEGRADADEERTGIMNSHAAIDRVLSSASRTGEAALVS